MIITGIMGFAIGLVTVMQVKATSPLTHNISGTAKAAAQVLYTAHMNHSIVHVFINFLSSIKHGQSLMAFYIWGNKATFNGILGIFLVLGGSGLYTWVQMRGSMSTTKK